MRQIWLCALSVLCIASMASASSVQRPRVTWIGHATVLIEGKEVRMLTDPFSADHLWWKLWGKTRPSAAPEQLKPIDIVLVSHTHPDHFDRKAIRRLSPGVIVMPHGKGGRMRTKDQRVIELKVGESITEKGIQIEAVPAPHTGARSVGYVLTLDGKTIYFCGDTKLSDQLAAIGQKGIDLMLMGYGGYPVLGSTWTTPQAIEAIQRVQPKWVIPVHWGMFNRWWTWRQPEKPEEFVRMAQSAAPNTQFRILHSGESHGL